MQIIDANRCLRHSKNWKFSLLFDINNNSSYEYYHNQRMKKSIKYSVELISKKCIDCSNKYIILYYKNCNIKNRYIAILDKISAISSYYKNGYKKNFYKDKRFMFF